MNKELKTETIRVRVGSDDRKVDSTGASRLTEVTLRTIRAIQEAAARQARRGQSQS